MQIHSSKVPFYVNISNPDRVQRILTWFNRPVYCIFFYLKKKKKSRKSWIFNPSGDIPWKNPAHCFPFSPSDPKKIKNKKMFMLSQIP
jgi:hypothetical protein